MWQALEKTGAKYRTCLVREHTGKGHIMIFFQLAGQTRECVKFKNFRV